MAHEDQESPKKQIKNYTTKETATQTSTARKVVKQQARASRPNLFELKLCKQASVGDSDELNCLN